MNLGSRLKKLRIEKNISQQELANYLSISRQAISNWETDRTQPNIETLIKLCNYYNISIDSMFSEAEKKEFNTNIKPKNNLSKQELFYKKLTPFIILTCVIFSLTLLLPKHIHIPFLFFFFLTIIFLLVLMLVYYLVKRLFKE